MRSQPPELKQGVLFQPLGETNVIEVIEAVNGVTEGLVIFLLNEQVIVCVVNGLDVQLLVIS